MKFRTTALELTADGLLINALDSELGLEDSLLQDLQHSVVDVASHRALYVRDPLLRFEAPQRLMEHKLPFCRGDGDEEVRLTMLSHNVFQCFPLSLPKHIKVLRVFDASVYGHIPSTGHGDRTCDLAGQCHVMDQRKEFEILPCLSMRKANTRGLHVGINFVPTVHSSQRVMQACLDCAGSHRPENMMRICSAASLRNLPWNLAADYD